MQTVLMTAFESRKMTLCLLPFGNEIKGYVYLVVCFFAGDVSGNPNVV